MPFFHHLELLFINFLNRWFYLTYLHFLPPLFVILQLPHTPHYLSETALNKRENYFPLPSTIDTFLSLPHLAARQLLNLFGSPSLKLSSSPPTLPTGFLPVFLTPASHFPSQSPFFTALKRTLFPWVPLSLHTLSWLQPPSLPWHLPNQYSEPRSAPQTLLYVAYWMSLLRCLTESFNTGPKHLIQVWTYHFFIPAIFTSHSITFPIFCNMVFL